MNLSLSWDEALGEALQARVKPLRLGEALQALH